jgi:hypothetical protein
MPPARRHIRTPADFAADPDHDPWVLEDCEDCHVAGRRRLDDPGCLRCGGRGTGSAVVRYFDNDASIIDVMTTADGWLTCPGCGSRFTTRDPNQWTGLRHVGRSLPCGQRLNPCPG